MAMNNTFSTISPLITRNLSPAALVSIIQNTQNGRTAGADTGITGTRGCCRRPSNFSTLSYNAVRNLLYILWSPSRFLHDFLPPNASLQQFKPLLLNEPFNTERLIKTSRNEPFKN
jgi:hypothetical protein